MTTKGEIYRTFVKPYRDANEEFRKRQNKTITEYIKKKYHTDTEFKEKFLEKAKERYKTDEGYRERSKQYARERYLRLKEKRAEEKAQEAALEFYRDLFT
jgi:hypothetical protein